MMNPENLIVYGQESVQVKRPEWPKIRLHVKSGTFTFSITAKELLGIEAGDQVMVAQDKLSKEEWYIWKVKTGGLKLKRANYSGKVNAIIVRNAALAQGIANSVEFTGAAGTMKIAKEPIVFENDPETKYWPIITASLNKFIQS